MSHHKTGTSRYQMSFGSLEDQISPENPVRIIDAFVDMLDLKTFGFQHVQAKQKGAPGFHPSVLLKIYFYGYLNRIRPAGNWKRNAGATSRYDGCARGRRRATTPFPPSAPIKRKKQTSTTVGH
jgi:hypothetical protein